MAKIHVTTTINGAPTEFLCDANQTLLDVLRDTLGLTGSKEGCGSGDCGACSVMVNGRLVCSCLVLAPEAEGEKIETIEGMAEGDKLHPLQKKFVEMAALQCGICTPGFLIASKALLEQEPEPDRDRGPLLAGRQPLPLHRLRQDRHRGHGCGRRNEGVRQMSKPTRSPNASAKYKWIGTRPDRPDGADKVTGRARFGADFNLPGQLIGKVLRSPHPHAIIKSIDTSKAEALAGVKAVVTAKDFPEQPNLIVPTGEMQVNLRDITRNIMAREKVLYEGHPVAAVAATIGGDRQAGAGADQGRLQGAAARDRRRRGDEARRAGAARPPDHRGRQAAAPTKPSNIAKRIEFNKGDTKAGFAEAEVVIEKDYTTQAVHQGYIEPHAALASAAEDGQVQVWSTTQGHFQVRGFCARLLDIDTSQIRVTPTEIGGGFGGKTVVYLEPLAIRLSQKSGKPVKMTMTREEVFRASGPAPGGNVKVKIGATKDGRIVAAECTVEMQAGAFPGSPVGPACMCAFACYDIDNIHIVGFDVVSNRPKVAAYRAPGAPISAWAVEIDASISWR